MEKLPLALALDLGFKQIKTQLLNETFSRLPVAKLSLSVTKVTDQRTECVFWNERVF